MKLNLIQITLTIVNKYELTHFLFVCQFQANCRKVQLGSCKEKKAEEETRCCELLQRLEDDY